MSAFNLWLADVIAQLFNDFDDQSNAPHLFLFDSANVVQASVRSPERSCFFYGQRLRIHWPYPRWYAGDSAAWKGYIFPSSLDSIGEPLGHMSQPPFGTARFARRPFPRAYANSRKAGIDSTFYCCSKYKVKGVPCIYILLIPDSDDHYSQFPASEVQGYRDQLDEINANMIDGKLLGTDSSRSAGQEIVAGLLSRCLLWSEIVLDRYRDLTASSDNLADLAFTHLRQGKIDPRFKATYAKLCDIRNALERLSITQAWSLRETDLYNYQRQLDRIDESRVNGNFEDEYGAPADLHAQRVR